MAEEDRGVLLACVCIALAIAVATLIAGNPRVAAWSVLPLGIAAWMLYQRS